MSKSTKVSQVRPFPLRPVPKGQSARCCAHWLTQQVPGEMLGQQLSGTSSQRQKTPSTVGFRITHWSLSQYTLPSWSKGHKQGLLPLGRSLFSTRFKVNLLFFFPWPMKRQLFSISGTGPQMKKTSQNKEENSVTPKYCKIGFTIQGLKQRSTQTSRVTGYNRQGRVWWVFFNKSNLTCWKPTGTKKFTAVFYSWKAQLPGLPRTVRWFSSFLTS